MKPDTIWGSFANTHKHRWANLTLVDEWQESSEENGVYDSHGGPKMWKLLCDCGHEFTIEKETFPGRRIARNCNRPECPYVKKPPQQRMPIGRPVTVDGAAFSIYIPMEIAKEVMDYANKQTAKGKPMSFSKAMGILAHEGYVQAFINED